MIADAIKSVGESVWAQISYYLTLQFLDPFWSWLVVLLGLYFVVMLICYFFGTFWPILRVIGGVMLLIATFGLYAYARGERDARAHDAKGPKAKPPDNSGGWR